MRFGGQGEEEVQGAGVFGWLRGLAEFGGLQASQRVGVGGLCLWAFIEVLEHKGQMGYIGNTWKSILLLCIYLYLLTFMTPN